MTDEERWARVGQALERSAFLSAGWDGQDWDVELSGIPHRRRGVGPTLLDALEAALGLPGE